LEILLGSARKVRGVVATYETRNYCVQCLVVLVDL
jgi:hypothetical protein